MLSPVFKMNFTTEIAPYTILDLNKDTDYPLEQLIHTLPIVILWAMVKSKTGYLSNSLYLLVRVVLPNASLLFRSDGHL